MYRLLTLSLLLFTLGLSAAPARAANAEDELRQFVENVRSLRARFVQTQSDEHGEILSSGAGSMALARPGKFRWNYEQPYAQLMVCDGERIWVYDPDLAQVTVRPADETLAGTPAELLAQKAALTDRYTVQDLGAQNGHRRVGLVPKDADSEFKSIELWLKAGVPSRLRFADPLGGSTEVELRDLEVNGAIDAAQFRFTPPRGVEVVESSAGAE